ncbi:hypothetical protein [Curtobacterium sp. CFBP9011]|uniref:hypothetical protein n=1 Tax=Curtobacterium sp. CFBP9011 TaxID=3096530 RepID=UPI002A6B6108|nr:hypothetical protein [Curtobacterium sp. CFBP9011]MDY1003841.1 hypothetical protein [Curtobacterium sp. CFBP9011]
MPHGIVSGVVFALTPTILLGVIFWFIMRAIIRADRTERAAYTKIEAEERARFERERSVTTTAPPTAD